MSFEANRSITLTPVTANLINQNRFVGIVTAGEIDESTAAGDAVGVSLEASEAGSNVPIPVSLLDGAKVEIEAGATVAAGVRIMSDATGRVITAAGPAGNRVLGWSLTGGDVNEVITIVGQKSAGQFVA